VKDHGLVVGTLDGGEFGWSRLESPMGKKGYKNCAVEKERAVGWLGLELTEVGEVVKNGRGGTYVGTPTVSGKGIG